MSTQSNQHLEHLQQLDDILNYISSKGNLITNREQYFKEIGENKWEVIQSPVDKYNLAYEFLISENFITKTSDGFKMNYKGLMRLGPNSFVNEYNMNKNMKKFNKWFWILAPLFSGIAAITSTIILIGKLCKWWDT